MTSIRARLVASYLIVILIPVSVLVGILIFAIHQYYVRNVEEILLQQSETSALFYNRYLADGNLEGQAPDLLDSFSQNTRAQVQMIDASGRLLLDSAGTAEDAAGFSDQDIPGNDPDVRRALSGETGVWRGRWAATGEDVLAVSQPLVADGQVTGVVRYITSMEGMQRIVRQFTSALVLAGLAVAAAAVLVALRMAVTITGPVHELTKTAAQMAKGNFRVRANKRADDELGRLADTLNYMAEEISRSEKVKNEFISSVSHELRTPLTSIKGWVITLRTGNLDNKQEIREGLEIIERESERLVKLVEELLDFSRFEGGRIKLKPVTFPAEEWLRSVVRQMKPRADRLGMDLTVEASEPLPVIHADPDRLKQVLINILDNAFKFTPAGGSVRLRAEKDGGQLKITVSDTGPGIAPEDLPYVKQKFYKGSGHAPGSGLGLAISDEIIRLHHGRLEIDSRPGAGTSVTIRIPF